MVHNQSHASDLILVKISLKCDFVQGPPGPGGLLGEMGKAGPLVSTLPQTVRCQYTANGQ